MTDPRKRAWLVAFACTGKLVAAAAAAKVSIRTGYDWRHDPDDRTFQAALVVARALQGDFAEAEVKRRAFEGVDEPIYQGGRLVGTRTRFSDILSMFYLKGLMPEKYREHVEHSGPQGGAIPLTASVSLNLSQLTTAELAARAESLAQRLKEA